MNTVWVRYQFIAWHSWKAAPPPRSYLAHSHRHLFHVRAELEVEHHDREVEFHDLLDVVRTACEELTQRSDRLDLGSMSCEMIGEWIGKQVAERWPGRSVSITVSEDDECGATVRFAS